MLNPKKIAILACGLAGESWVALFLHYGFNVRAWDPDTIPLETLADRIKGLMFQLQSLGEGTKP